jgi:hypothetical protein
MPLSNDVVKADESRLVQNAKVTIQRRQTEHASEGSVRRPADEQVANEDAEDEEDDADLRCAGETFRMFNTLAGSVMIHSCAKYQAHQSADASYVLKSLKMYPLYVHLVKVSDTRVFFFVVNLSSNVLCIVDS